MPKKTSDYDNVFKTMKSKHKRLVISVINDIFGNEIYLLECQSYDDGSMAIRIAEAVEQATAYLEKYGKQPVQVCKAWC